MINTKKMRVYSFIILMTTIVSLTSCCQKPHRIIQIGDHEMVATPIITEDFSTDLSNWTVEQLPGGTVQVQNGQMDIDDFSGCTVWFNEKLQAPLMIEYDAVVVDAGGPNDRVSDLNCFWLAKDIHSANNFFQNSENRGGKFQNYHAMQLYYVGLGGHDNTKTRFRRYAGGGDRPCLPEHDLSADQYLITPNTMNKIRIIVYKNQIQYYRNDILIYDFRDEAPYTSGYFGIRTYKNHMTVDNFTVYKLMAKPF